MKANDVIRYINYEILRTNDDLFEYLKKRVIKYELKAKKITTANVDEIVNRCINLIQGDQSIKYQVLVVEQLKQFYNLQADQVSLWNEGGGDQMFRNDSEKFTEQDDEFHMHSELFAIEDRFNYIDEQSNHSQGPFYNSMDKEIIPQPAYNSKYDNRQERLKLDIMDLEDSDSDETPQEQTLSLKQQKLDFGKNKNLLALEAKREELKQKFLIKYSHNFDLKDDYKRFYCKDYWDGEIENIFDKSLYEFPIFGLNDFYIKAIGNVLSIKLKQVYTLKKQTLDLIDKVTDEENARNVQRPDIKTLLRSDLQMTDSLGREINKPTKGALTSDQRLEAKTKLQKYSGYKPNTKVYEEYHIPVSNTKPLNPKNPYFDTKRNMSKKLNKMCKSFTKFNNRMVKSRSFLVLKENCLKPKGTKRIYDILDYIFSVGESVRAHKIHFLHNLTKICDQQKEREDRLRGKIQETSDILTKHKCLGAWRKNTNSQQARIEKVKQFYSQNLMIKGFFTLARYAKKKRELKNREKNDTKKVNNFILQRYFAYWRRAHTHKMNQLQNRK